MTPEAEAMFREVMEGLPRNGIFVDLGANVGNVSARALEYGHEVYAFEPDPAALAVLQSRFGTDPRVKIIPKAVGAAVRTARFFRHPEGNTEYSSLLRHDAHRGGNEVEVEVVDIVDFLRGLNRPTTVLKMDIEGAETECLEAIFDAGFHRSIGLILVEPHDHFSPDIASRMNRIRARIAADDIKNIRLDWL
jgi:FkbM family methyltransferase